MIKRLFEINICNNIFKKNHEEKMSLCCRRSDSTQFSQDDLLSFDKSKLKRIKPAVLISIGTQEEETKAGDNSKEDCSMKKGHRKHNHSWQIQKLFYVEEPKWVAIDSDYIDGTSRRLDDADPYILSRGKKIFRLKDLEQMDKLIEDNEEFFDYLSRNKRSSTKYRTKRSIETSENFRNNAIDKKNNRKEKINHYGFFQSIDRGTKRKTDNSYFANNTNKRNKRSTSLKSKKASEAYEKHNTHELDSMKSEESVKKNKTDMFEMMEKIYDKLDDLRGAYDDSFILSGGKHTFDNRTESSNKKYASHGEAIYEKPWKNTYSETSESKREKKNKKSILENEKNTTEKTDSQLTHISAKISKKKIDLNREKRDACKSLACKIGPQLPDKWLLKSFGEEIQDTLALERRDKTSEFLNKLIEPSFVISRGKKALQSKFENNPYSMFQSRDIKMMRFPLARSLLQMLLTERCNNSNDCDIDARKLVGRRDRRGALDDIFAEEEPFYVGRGKRMKPDTFLTQPLQRKNINSPEKDVKQ